MEKLEADESSKTDSAPGGEKAGRLLGELLKERGLEPSADLAPFSAIAARVHAQRAGPQRPTPQYAVSRSTLLEAALLFDARLATLLANAGFEQSEWERLIGFEGHDQSSSHMAAEISVHREYIGAALDVYASEHRDQPVGASALVFGILTTAREGGGRVGSRLKKAGLRFDEALEELSSLISSPRVADTPVFTTDGVAAEDRLGRAGFAKSLAIRLRRLWQQTNTRERRGPSYVAQLDGPWGAGKSTLLRLLRTELHNEDRSPGLPPASKSRYPWIVVDFNAWQNQRLDPPWWPLLDEIYQGARGQLAGSRRRDLEKFESSWRRRHLPGSRAGWLGLTVALCGIGLLTLFVVLLSLPSQSLAHLGSTVAVGSGLVGLVLTGLGASKALSAEWRNPSSASAKLFEELATDPMGELTEHFKDLLTRIDRPLIVFIDDLDRCHSSFVVRLLEGVLTLFSDSRVFYVVAADRRWLTASFETEYDHLTSHVGEPGRPLGRLFLEKAFQLEMSVPAMSEELKSQYVEHLLEHEEATAASVQIGEEQATREFASLANEQRILEQLAKRVDDPLREQARRDAAIVQLATQEVEAKTEKFLARFSRHLESNPRAIKRLVQAYGVNLSIVVLAEPAIAADLAQRSQLVLWTILASRWPSLADRLRGNPSLLQEWPSREEELDPLGELFRSEPVRNVIEGKDVEGSPGLEVESLSRLVRILSPRD